MTIADYAGIHQGYLATKAAIKYLNGEKIPKRIILPVLIVDKANAMDWTVPFETRKLLDYDAMSKKYGVW